MLVCTTGRLHQLFAVCIDIIHSKITNILVFDSIGPQRPEVQATLSNYLHAEAFDKKVAQCHMLHMQDVKACVR
jgi:Ulp1 family protease